MTLACLLLARSFVGAAGGHADAGPTFLSVVTLATFVGVRGVGFERLVAAADRDVGLRELALAMFISG